MALPHLAYHSTGPGGSALPLPSSTSKHRDCGSASQSTNIFCPLLCLSSQRRDVDGDRGMVFMQSTDIY